MRMEDYIRIMEIHNNGWQRRRIENRDAIICVPRYHGWESNRVVIRPEGRWEVHHAGTKRETKRFTAYPERPFGIYFSDWQGEPAVMADPQAGTFKLITCWYGSWLSARIRDATPVRAAYWNASRHQDGYSYLYSFGHSSVLMRPGVIIHNNGRMEGEAVPEKFHCTSEGAKHLREMMRTFRELTYRVALLKVTAPQEETPKEKKPFVVQELLTALQSGDMFAVVEAAWGAYPRGWRHRNFEAGYKTWCNTVKRELRKHIYKEQ